MPTVLQRTITIEQRAKREDDLVEIAISSEAPYERWFGIEILRHSADAIDMTRLGDGRHPLLLNHDTDNQIGVIQKAWIDDDKVLRGLVKFSRSALGQEIKQDVEDGIRSHVSVGYMIDEIEEIERAEDGSERVVRTLSGEEFTREMRAQHGDDFYRSGLAAARGKGDTPPTFVVTRWCPFEGSIVPVPADVTVGVGRSAGVEPAPPVVPEVPATQTPVITVEKRKMETPQKTPAELELERRDGIATLGELYAKYVPPKEVADFARSGKSVDQFKDFIIEKMQSKHTDASAMMIGMDAGEAKRYSLGRALVAALTGNWAKAGFERECSEAVGKLWDRSPEGFFIPPDVFRRDFNVGTATEAGNLVATQLRGDLYVDALRNSMVFGRANATYLTGLTANVDLPRKATAGTLGMLTEIGSGTETAPVTAKATLSPKRISAFTEVSKQALIQSAMSLENMIRDDLVTGAAVLLENQIINGAGTGAEITGLRNTSGIGTATALGANGGAPTWAMAVDLETQCANANAEPDRFSGYLVNTRTRGKLKTVQKGTNLPFIWENGDTPLNGYRAFVTNNVPSNLTKGTATTVASAALFCSDFSMVTIGLFGAPDVVVDPYTKADTGQVKITLNQFADMKCRQPACCSKIEDVLTT
jgi:HK97 family phage major capsid protein